MGGSIRVVIRDRDGSVWSNERWTNAMPGLTRNPRFIDDEDALFAEYKAKTEWHTDDHTLTPTIEYGIVVIDRMTHTVIDCNGYGSALQLGLVTFSNSPDDPEYLELLRRGLLIYQGKTLTVPEGADIEKHLDAMWRADRHGKISINCAPWTYVHLIEGEYKTVRERMKELGIAFSPRDDAAWNALLMQRYAQTNSENEAAEAEMAAALRVPATDIDEQRAKASAATVTAD